MPGGSRGSWDDCTGGCSQPRASAHLLKDLADGFALIHLLPRQNLLEPLVHFGHAARKTAQSLTEYSLSTYRVQGAWEGTETSNVTDRGQGAAGGQRAAQALQSISLTTPPRWMPSSCPTTSGEP